MRGLIFGVSTTPGDPLPDDALPAEKALATVPMDLREIPDPALPADDWVILKTSLCGICGSDAKQVFMDGDGDSAMTSLISFPQVLGHEVIGEIVEAGGASGRRVGERVVLNPWLSCGPRGISPMCPSCQAGDFNLCHHFTEGHLAPGIHTGNSSTASGGFAELVPAHTSMAIPCPDDVPDEIAVLADPFSVALHSVLRNPPPPGGKALVYGIGALGLSTLAVLAKLHPDVEVGAIVKWQHQADAATRHGAKAFFHDPNPALVDAIADWAESKLYKPWEGLPMTFPGGVDIVYDTVAAPETMEVSVRVLRARGRMVMTGVSQAGRFEWSPWYFKELNLIGSNAFGVEEVGGVRKHAIAHYLDWAASGGIDVSDMLTHRFTLDTWRDAFGAIARQGETGTIKVAFDYR
ncbi:MAG TPA: alcohol dehydrogenase catalytic domain-containing protein [Mycobacteriales bacterium]|nr:alcohol dehydrogenase catalytic domain-containing protein [Mycobacteriales bacterium]